LEEMNHAHVAVERNLNNVVGEKRNFLMLLFMT
jgi:hypothetical protein